MSHNFKPRNFTAVFLSIIWLAISLFFIGQGTFTTLWSMFAVIALLIGIAGVWVLFTDTYDNE